MLKFNPQMDMRVLLDYGFRETIHMAGNIWAGTTYDYTTRGRKTPCLTISKYADNRTFVFFCTGWNSRATDIPNIIIDLIQNGILIPEGDE